MATFRGPARVLEPLTIIERVLELRMEAGHPSFLFLFCESDSAACLDASGFDAFAITDLGPLFCYGGYSACVVPSGDRVRGSTVTH